MFDLKIYEEKMEKAIDVLKREFSGLRTGGLTSLLDFNLYLKPMAQRYL